MLTSFSGYPPADHIARDYLTGATSKDEAYDRASAFLEALFIQTKEVVSKFDPSYDYYGVAREFRRLMTEGQKMTKHNAFREEFYSQVYAQAKQLESRQVREFPISFHIWPTSLCNRSLRAQNPLPNRKTR
jgi:hypothetical protein